MKAFLCLLLAVHAVTAVTLFKNSFQENEQLLNEWDDFKERHGKSYLNAEDESVRYAIYLSNRHLIDEHNAEHSQGKHRYSMKLNHFADMLQEEFVATMNGYKQHARVPGEGATYLRLAKQISIPESMDWRKEGAVTPVKDQRQCGSCWAFSSTGSLEGQHFRKTGELVSLSEQNLVDCSSAFGNQGCNGGLMDNAFKYIKANGGIDTESSYPYDGAVDPCRFKRTDVGPTDVGFKEIPEGDEDALKEAVAVYGPVSVAIDASQPSFRFYHEGIYDDPNCSDMLLDHAVLVVGYGNKTVDRDFWIVKNSWSENWGDQGYIKMARNQNNVCGIASNAVLPLV